MACLAESLAVWSLASTAASHWVQRDSRCCWVSASMAVNLVRAVSRSAADVGIVFAHLHFFESHVEFEGFFEEVGWGDLFLLRCRWLWRGRWRRGIVLLAGCPGGRGGIRCGGWGRGGCGRRR